LAPWQFIHPTRVRHVPMLPLTDVEAWRAERARGCGRTRSDIGGRVATPDFGGAVGAADGLECETSDRTRIWRTMTVSGRSFTRRGSLRLRY